MQTGKKVSGTSFGLFVSFFIFFFIVSLSTIMSWFFIIYKVFLVGAVTKDSLLRTDAFLLKTFTRHRRIAFPSSKH